MDFLFYQVGPKWKLGIYVIFLTEKDPKIHSDKPLQIGSEV